MWDLLHERLSIILKFKFVTQSRANITCDQEKKKKKDRLIAGKGKNE